MTVLDYSSIIPFPPPVTSGSGVQPYQDPNGDMWVAKVGWRGGNWYRAVDVCNCRFYMANNQAVSGATQLSLGWASDFRDPLGQRNGNNWVIPISGRYLIYCEAMVGAPPGGTSQLQALLYLGGSAWLSGGVTYWDTTAISNAYVGCSTLDFAWFNAGQSLGWGINTPGSPTMAGLKEYTYFGLSYQGTN